VLEQFSYLSLKYSESYGKRYEFNSSVPCPICNGNHKEKSIWDDIKGEWGAGKYYRERTYWLECRKALNHDIPIVFVKA
jgi:hypothetical protein